MINVWWLSSSLRRECIFSSVRKLPISNYGTSYWTFTSTSNGYERHTASVCHSSYTPKQTRLGINILLESTDVVYGKN